MAELGFDAPSSLRIGTAGWNVAPLAAAIATTGSHLQRYATLFNAVEINSSFYGPHRPATYARWAASVPADFVFAVKVPREMTHERRLVDCGRPIERFAGEVAALGPKLGPLLVQCPPSLGFDPAIAEAFFAALQQAIPAPVVCEPRHPKWFTAAAEALLTAHRIARVGADPAVVPTAAEPGGWDRLVYLRMHGAPRVYHTSYGEAALADIARRLAGRAGAGRWCIFDNTAAGHAIGNASALRALARH